MEGLRSLHFVLYHNKTSDGHARKLPTEDQSGVLLLTVPLLPSLGFSLRVLCNSQLPTSLYADERGDQHSIGVHQPRLVILAGTAYLAAVSRSSGVVWL